jgi:hypothetical protein
MTSSSRSKLSSPASSHAAHLLERVSPEVPIRQYVLSPPSELVGLLAAREEVLAPARGAHEHNGGRAAWPQATGVLDAGIFSFCPTSMRSGLLMPLYLAMRIYASLLMEP